MEKQGPRSPLSQAATPASLHIASLIVHVRPHLEGVLVSWLESQRALEMRLSNDAGKLIVLVETEHHLQINPMIEDIRNQPGVLNVALVYHEELSLAEADDVLQEDADVPQPVNIVGEG
ncbi:chaperone NapD [Microbulbifer agarilyticus]|uniref:chaperone NapD n=1 Tax=Microbulbifer agarilyticus TaxID=260552 RepID=UPI001C98631E|nr:chaperone NapD [Microbulbifer agarilyticus]MBY6190054.1 chaperone NapD [Microbulbifer agarilyticus]MBY6210056.1 chaperone NapD [Microbulbifer agarilyticus]MCA0892546.1 chaperone NapD [Microbulbifer agarilyticus]